MLNDRRLIRSVATLPITPASGLAFRAVKLKYLLKKVGNENVLNAEQALSAIGSRKAGGRYNPAVVLEALYLADNPANAFLEVGVMRQTASGLEGVKGAPHILLSVEYQLKAVLNIVDSIAQTTIGTNLSELTASWRDLNAQGQIAPTQELGSVVYSMGNIEALKVPSAKVLNAYNLIIFPDRLSGTSAVRVYDDSGLINTQIP